MMRRLGNIEKERLMWVGFGVLSVVVIALMQMKSTRTSAKTAEGVRRRRSESRPHGVRRHRTAEEQQQQQQQQHRSKKNSSGNNRTGEGNSRGVKRSEKHDQAVDPTTSTGGDLNTSSNSKHRRHDQGALKSTEQTGSSTRRVRGAEPHGAAREESASALNTSAERAGILKERSSMREGSSLRPPLSATKRNHSVDRTGSRDREGSNSGLNQASTTRALVHSRRAVSGSGFQSIHTNVQPMRSDRDRVSEKVSGVSNNTRSRSGGMAASTEALAGTSTGGSLQVRRHSVNGRNSPATSSAVDTRSDQERLRMPISKESEGKMRYIHQWMSDESHSAHVVRREGVNALASATEQIDSDAPARSTASNTARSAAFGEDELFFTRSMTNSQAADLRLLTRDAQRRDATGVTTAEAAGDGSAATGLDLRAPPALGGGNRRRDGDENDSDLPLCPEPPSREGKTDPRVRVAARESDGHRLLDVEIDLDGISPIQPVRSGAGEPNFEGDGASPNPRNPRPGLADGGNDSSPHSHRNRQMYAGDITPEGAAHHGQGDLSGDSYSLDLTPTTRVRVSSSRPQQVHESGAAVPNRSSVDVHLSGRRALGGSGTIESNPQRLHRPTAGDNPAGAREAGEDILIDSPEQSSRSSTLSAPATQRGAVGILTVTGAGKAQQDGDNGEVQFTDPVVAGELYALKRLLVFHVNSLNAMPLNAQSWLELHDLLVDLPPQLYALVNVLSNDNSIPALPELRMGDQGLQQLVNDTKSLLSGGRSQAAVTYAERLRSSQGRRYKLSLSRRTVEVDVNRRGSRVTDPRSTAPATDSAAGDRSAVQNSTRRFRDLEVDGSEDEDDDDDGISGRSGRSGGGGGQDRGAENQRVVNATSQGHDSSVNSDSRRGVATVNSHPNRVSDPRHAHVVNTPHSSPALSRVGGPEMTSPGSSFAGTPPGTLPSHASGGISSAAFTRDHDAAGGNVGGARSNLFSGDYSHSPSGLNVGQVKDLLNVLATPDAQRIMQQLQAECSSLGVSATPPQESTTGSGHSAGRGNSAYQRAQTSVSFASHEQQGSSPQRPSVNRAAGGGIVEGASSVPRERTRESSYGAVASPSSRFQRSQTAVASPGSPGNSGSKRPAQTSRYLFSKYTRDSEPKDVNQRGNNHNDAGRGNLSHGSADSSGRNHESGSFSSGGGRGNGVSNTTPGNTYNGKGRGSVFSRLYPGKSASPSAPHVEDVPSPYYAKQHQQQQQQFSSPAQQQQQQSPQNQQQQQQTFIKLKPPMMF